MENEPEIVENEPEIAEIQPEIIENEPEIQPETKKRGRPKKEPAPKPEPKKRGRPPKPIASPSPKNTHCGRTPFYHTNYRWGYIQSIFAQGTYESQ